MTAFTEIFLALLLLTTALRLWLGWRHVSFIQSRRQQVPEAFARSISLEAHQKAADYSSAKTRVAMLEAIVSAALLLVLTVGAGLLALDGVWQPLLTQQELFRGALV